VARAGRPDDGLTFPEIRETLSHNKCGHASYTLNPGLKTGAEVVEGCPPGVQLIEGMNAMSIANKARRTSPPLTEPLTITLTGSDLEHLNAFREAEHALYNKPVDGYTNKKLDELKRQRREAATDLALLLSDLADGQLAMKASQSK